MAARAPKERRAAPLDIRDVQAIKHDRVFLLCDRSGEVPEGNQAALGLYFRDTRFLSRWEMRVNGAPPLFLHAEADRNYSMVVETTLPVLGVDPEGGQRRENVSVSRQRWLQEGMREAVRVRNYGGERRRVRIEFLFGADFVDLFEVRGLSRSRPAVALQPGVDDGCVRFGADGIDGVRRTLEISFDPPPRRMGAERATFDLSLAPRSEQTIEVRVRPSVGGIVPPAVGYGDLAHEYSSWRRNCTQFRVSNDQFQRFLDRAVLDLRMMQTDDGEGPAIDAGVPWFSTLFGRDSIITAYEALGVNRDLALGTLRTLAKYQGSVEDEWREEEPGKILHELRVGELAGAAEIPHTPYYGSADATPLWLVLYGYVWMWTGDRDFAEELWPHAVRALEWIDRWGDSDGDGYVEYRKRSARGLDNQGWKDSREGIVHADGSFPDPPIALCEVQGYVYDAKRRVARVARALGHEKTADALEASAAELKRRFNEDFWIPDQSFFAVALDGEKRPVASITSNPGHCLWSGIVDPDKAIPVARRLVSSDLASGWGIRTLSTRSPAFDPIGYHTGSVWPHDNAIAAHGLRAYGFDDESNTIIEQLATAAAYFRDARFPELFCGFSREEAAIPVEYPVACRPQAWATGAALLMLRSYGGIFADAPARSLEIVRPRMPEWLDRVEVSGMRVGDARVDLTYTCHEGVTGVQVLRKEGDLNVVVRY